MTTEAVIVRMNPRRPGTLPFRFLDRSHDCASRCKNNGVADRTAISVCRDGESSIADATDRQTSALGTIEGEESRSKSSTTGIPFRNVVAIVCISSLCARTSDAFEKMTEPSATKTRRCVVRISTMNQIPRIGIGLRRRIASVSSGQVVKEQAASTAIPTPESQGFPADRLAWQRQRYYRLNQPFCVHAYVGFERMISIRLRIRFAMRSHHL